MKSENIGWFFVYFKSEAAASRFMLDDTLEVSKNNFVSTTSFLAYANFIDRFKDDHIYIDMDDCFYLQDGVVLNCFGTLGDKIVHSETKLFWKDFYGPFAGVKFDKRSKTVIAYTNQTGEKPVYYFSNEEYFMLSSSVYIVSKILQKNNLQYTLNEKTANFLLTYYHTLWILKKHSSAAKYVWEKTGKKIDATSVDNTKNMKAVIKNASYMQWLVKLHRYTRQKKMLHKENMNPSAKWYLESAGLKNFIDTYYVNSISKADKYPNIRVCVKRFLSKEVSVKSYLY